MSITCWPTLTEIDLTMPGIGEIIFEEISTIFFGSMNLFKLNALFEQTCKVNLNKLRNNIVFLKLALYLSNLLLCPGTES